MSDEENGGGRFPRPFLAGGWRVEPARCLLARGSQEIHLEPRVMDVLVCLARRADQVVSRDELIREVWEGRFVSDEVISVSIFELRKALGDNAREPRGVLSIGLMQGDGGAGVGELGPVGRLELERQSERVAVEGNPTRHIGDEDDSVIHFSHSYNSSNTTATETVKRSSVLIFSFLAAEYGARSLERFATALDLHPAGGEGFLQFQLFGTDQQERLGI